MKIIKLLMLLTICAASILSSKIKKDCMHKSLNSEDKCLKFSINTEFDYKSNPQNKIVYCYWSGGCKGGAGVQKNKDKRKELKAKMEEERAKAKK
mmetsp:Transcript_9991/g.10302  ORF Transcript_9991/g.10302 Transcript_9991/m.10302 type:complete len:95 (+) Transcript_9991:10-294(+)